MPRKTLKTTPGVRKYGVKSNYTPETLQTALEKVSSGAMSRIEASKVYKIPPVTLYYKMKDQHNKVVGRPVTFSKHLEDILKAHLLLLSDLGLPLTMLDFRIIVRDYLNSNNIKIKQFKDNLPGYEWGTLFIERHPEIKEKFAHNISRKRAQVTREKVEDFFKNLQTEVEGVSPKNIYNMDESGFHDEPGKKKLLFRRDSRHSDVIKNTSKSCYTIVFCANAEGETLPPFFIFKGQKLWSDWLFQGPPGSRMSVSKSGWIETSIFEEWLENHFIPFVNKNDGKKILLCDNLSAHISPKALRLCEENNISFICLIPNSTHLLQPLDVGYFSALKTAWRKVLNDYRKTSRGKKVQALPKSLFSQLVQKSLTSVEGTSSENVKAGFRSCGIFPFSPERVLSKLPAYTEETNVRESVGESFRNFIEEVRKDDLNVTKGKKYQLPVTSGKSVSAEEVEKFYKEKENGTVGRSFNSNSNKRGRPVGSKNKKKKKIEYTNEIRENKQVESEGNEKINEVQSLGKANVETLTVHDQEDVVLNLDNSIADVCGMEVEEEYIINSSGVLIEVKSKKEEAAKPKSNKRARLVASKNKKEKKIENIRENEKEKVETITIVAQIHQPPQKDTGNEKRNNEHEEVQGEGKVQTCKKKNEDQERDEILCLDNEVADVCGMEIVEEYIVDSSDVFLIETTSIREESREKFCLFKEEGSLFPGRIKTINSEDVTVSLLQKNFLGGWSWPSKMEQSKILKSDIVSVIEDSKISSKNGKVYIDDDLLFMEWGE